MPFPSPGYLPDPEIEPRSPAPQAESLPSEPPGKPLAISKTLISEGHGVHTAPHLLYEKRGLECISGLQCEKAERKALLGGFHCLIVRVLVGKNTY